MAIVSSWKERANGFDRDDPIVGISWMGICDQWGGLHWRKREVCVLYVVRWIGGDRSRAGVKERVVGHLARVLGQSGFVLDFIISSGLELVPCTIIFTNFNWRAVPVRFSCSHGTLSIGYILVLLT